ncbi:MAG TPA: response regulator transcription factor [Symbiobacteriaceae bacterium]|jgi:DNA-binding NarL/FixJ family response regulator|nr:response regulator transcription factor [Symbiobacteriaceae bacterium]
MVGSRGIRVLLADDHNLVRAGIAQLLSLEPDIQVVAEAGDGAQALAQAREHRPDLILMDLAMPRCDGFEALERIRRELPETVIVVLTYSADPGDIGEALRRGAQGYLLKSLEPQTLAGEIRKAVRGEAPMSGAVAKTVLAGLRQEEPPAPEPVRSGTSPLTKRELEIVSLIAKGAKNREIGAQLFLAENTIKNHIKRILEKLQVENRAQAVAWAMREGLLPDGP